MNSVLSKRADAGLDDDAMGGLDSSDVNAAGNKMPRLPAMLLPMGVQMLSVPGVTSIVTLKEGAQQLLAG